MSQPNVFVCICVFSKALESLANRDITDAAHIRERAHREMDSLRDMFNQRISELEEVCTHTHTHTHSLPTHSHTVTHSDIHRQTRETLNYPRHTSG